MFVPRIRSVKPELFSHEGLYEAEVHYKLPLRLAFIALFGCCDREGRFRWQPRRLKLDMLPYDNVDITDVLNAFIERGFIKKYKYKGEIYGCIPSWFKHQKVNHREGDSTLPGIEDSIETTNEIEKSKAISDQEDIEGAETCGPFIVDNGETCEISLDDDCPVCESLVDDACFTREPSVTEASRACPGGRELEGKGRGREEKEYIVASMTRPRGGDQKIQQVFMHWKTVMQHPNANLDQKRKAIIAKALKSGYSETALCEAITGCSYTPHNMGNNDRGQRYDGLHVILRDGDQIDRFIRNCQYPPHPMSDSDRKSLANVQTLQGWMNKKIAEEK